MSLAQPRFRRHLSERTWFLKSLLFCSPWPRPWRCAASRYVLSGSRKAGLQGYPGGKLHGPHERGEPALVLLPLFSLHAACSLCPLQGRPFICSRAGMEITRPAQPAQLHALSRRQKRASQETGCPLSTQPLVHASVSGLIPRSEKLN